MGGAAASHRAAATPDRTAKLSEPGWDSTPVKIYTFRARSRRFFEIRDLIP
jgi:hypothetical protein